MTRTPRNQDGPSVAQMCRDQGLGLSIRMNRGQITIRIGETDTGGAWLATLYETKVMNDARRWLRQRESNARPE